METVIAFTAPFHPICVTYMACEAFATVTMIPEAPVVEQMVLVRTISTLFSTVLSTACMSGRGTAVTCAQVGFASIVRQAVARVAFITHPSPERKDRS